MAVDHEQSDDVAGRGLSRRMMIKASAVAGAAAWTAPVIIDSLTSPAAAGSVCVPYWVKVYAQTAVQCFSACPGSSTLFPLNDPSGSADYRAHWASASCTDPGCNDLSPAADRMPASVSVEGNYYKVTLKSTCFFSSATTTNPNDWQIGGRYGGTTGSPGNDYLKALTTGSSAPVNNSAGCYENGGQHGWISKNYPTPTDSEGAVFLYVKFCCSS